MSKTAEADDKRDGKGRFLAGNRVGNGGRPKEAVGWKARCREFMDLEGWDKLCKLARDEGSKRHLDAIELICAYAYGKPTQPVGGDPETPLLIKFITPRSGVIGIIQDA